MGWSDSKIVSRFASDDGRFVAEVMKNPDGSFVCAPTYRRHRTVLTLPVVECADMEQLMWGVDLLHKASVALTSRNGGASAKPKRTRKAKAAPAAAAEVSS